MRGDGQNQLKISVPHPMTKTYRLILLLAALILLESPLSYQFLQILDVLTCPRGYIAAVEPFLGLSYIFGSGLKWTGSITRRFCYKKNNMPPP
jgi:hypothetical protein